MKKILSVVLALSMCLAPMTVFAETVTTPAANKEVTNPIADQLLADSAKLDTSVFEGAPGYILQDAFTNVSSVDKLGMPSGWDVDKRGGGISGAENTRCQIADSSNTALVSMSRDLLPHKSGKITFETAFMMETGAQSGYSYTLFGEDKIAFKIVTEADKLAVLNPDGTTKQVASYKPAEIVRIKAILDLDKKAYELVIDGKLVGSFKFAEDATQIDRILISTSNESKMLVWIRYVYLYFNYAVNENFMQAPEGAVPYDWNLEGGGTVSTVVHDPNQVYPDEYSYALYDPTTVDAVKLTKKFDDKQGKIVFHTRAIFETKGDSKISIGNGNQNAITIKTNPKDITTGNGTVLSKDYRQNLWYTFKVIADTNTKTADIYVNYQKVLSDVPFENNVASLNTITFETEVRKVMNMKIDDVQVYDDITPSDYVPAPQPVKPEGDLEVGMQMYSMWHDNHFGWDWITSYPDRIPYLGLYAEGKPEYADWVTKWQTEHGFTYRTEIFSRAVANKNQPVKLPTRYNAMYDGYFNSKYKEDIKFAVLYSGISTSTLGGMDDFKNNIVPHFIENFFKQPNYLLKDNKPVLFMYGAQNFVNVLGGLDKAEEAIAYLEAECIKAGFDGFILVPDGTSGGFIGTAPNFADKYVYSYGWQYNARTSKTQLQQNDSYFGTGANVVGSVTMGWGRNPWTEENAGEIFATPQAIKETIQGLKERFASVPNPTNMIILTCWDEYGEGHFFNPTRVHGFEYLNAVREAVTNLGPKTTEELPTAKALARLDSLYLGSRRALKLLPENPAPEYYDEMVDHSKLQLLAEWDFEKMGNLGGWKELKGVANVRWENGALMADSTTNDPGVWIETGVNIKASDVQMVKITTKSSASGAGQVFYQTDVDPDMGVNGKKFEFVLDSQDWKEYEGYPADRKKLQGNITAVRWDPQNLADIKFGIKKIQFWGYPTEEYKEPAKPIGLMFNGSELKNTQPPFVKDGVTYFAINRPLFGMGQFKTKFEWAKGTYTIEVDDKVAVITIGSNIMKVNGADVDLGAPAYYEAGNLFVPVRSTMEALGATVGWDNETGSIVLSKPDLSDTYSYQEKRDESKPFSWMFETRGTEDWTGYMDYSIFKAYQGALWIGMAGADPSIKSGTFELPADEYKYLRIRVKNETPASTMYFFFIRSDNSSWGGGKRYDIPVTGYDAEYKEYIVDLSTNEFWTGTVTQFRVDPVNPSAAGVTGDFYIDSVEFLKELPQ